MRWLILILLVSSCFAQIQGNLPTVTESSQDGNLVNTLGSIAWPENVAVNDTLVCGLNTQNDGSTFSISDSLSNTWTTTSVTTTPAPQTGSNVWMAYTRSTSAGADTITLTTTSGTGFKYMQCARFAGLNGVDGSVATNTAGSPSPIGTIATTQTTTVNGDRLVSIAAGAPFGGHYNLPASPGEFLSFESAASPSVAPLLMMQQAGALGSQTVTSNMFGGSATYAMQTLAFKPDSIRLTDTIMPDAGTGTAYSAQLHGIGGTAGLTYACTGLPANGFSLNTGTGVITASNPTATTSIGCTVTDGTVTSATDNLTINVGSLGAPIIRQYNKTWNPDNANASVSMPGVLCGETLVVIARGDDTHGGQGWVQGFAGTNNKISDTFNSTWRRMVGPIPGVTAWPLVVYVGGPVTQSGTDVITLKNNQSASSGRPISPVLEINGGTVFDTGASVQTITNTATGSYAVSYTTVVPNTLLISVSDSKSGATQSISAPFSTIFAAGGDVQGSTVYASALIGTAGSTTATTSFSGASTSDQQWEGLLIPVRASIAPSTCPAFTGAGEDLEWEIY